MKSCTACSSQSNKCADCLFFADNCRTVSDSSKWVTDVQTNFTSCLNVSAYDKVEFSCHGEKLLKIDSYNFTTCKTKTKWYWNYTHSQCFCNSTLGELNIAKYSQETQCDNCHPICKTCWGKEYYHCLSCNESDGPLVMNNRIINQTATFLHSCMCKFQYFELNSKCEKCHPSCGYCTQSTVDKCII